MSEENVISPTQEEIKKSVGSIPLYLLLTIVNDGQASSIIKIMNNAGASMSTLTHGKGTANSDIYEVFGLSNSDKQIIYTPIREDIYPEVKKGLLARFNVSSSAKGVAILFKINVVVSKSSYLFLANVRIEQKQNKGGGFMEDVKPNQDYEMIFVIVNDGYSDLVMDAAKKAGARGGTIFNARGTGNKAMEKFFGVVITPEKQIVLIVVPKEIRSTVLMAISKEAGLSTKGQGMAFSLPVSDVIGISDGNTSLNNEKVSDELPEPEALNQWKDPSI